MACPAAHAVPQDSRWLQGTDPKPAATPYAHRWIRPLLPQVAPFSSKAHVPSLLCKELCEKSCSQRGRNAPERGARGLQPLSAALRFHRLPQQAPPNVTKSPHPPHLPLLVILLTWTFPLRAFLCSAPCNPQHPMPGARCPRAAPSGTRICSTLPAPSARTRCLQPASSSKQSPAQRRSRRGRCTAGLGTGVVTQLGPSPAMGDPAVPLGMCPQSPALQRQHGCRRAKAGLARRGTKSGAGHE